MSGGLTVHKGMRPPRCRFCRKWIERAGGEGQGECLDQDRHRTGAGGTCSAFEARPEDEPAGLVIDLEVCETCRHFERLEGHPNGPSGICGRTREGIRNGASACRAYDGDPHLELKAETDRELSRVILGPSMTQGTAQRPVYAGELVMAEDIGQPAGNTVLLEPGTCGACSHYQAITEKHGICRADPEQEPVRFAERVNQGDDPSSRCSSYQGPEPGELVIDENGDLPTVGIREVGIATAEEIKRFAADKLAQWAAQGLVNRSCATCRKWQPLFEIDPTEERPGMCGDGQGRKRATEGATCEDWAPAIEAEIEGAEFVIDAGPLDAGILSIGERRRGCGTCQHWNFAQPEQSGEHRGFCSHGGGPLTLKGELEGRECQGWQLRQKQCSRCLNWGEPDTEGPGGSAYCSSHGETRLALGGELCDRFTARAHSCAECEHFQKRGLAGMQGGTGEPFGVCEARGAPGVEVRASWGEGCLDFKSSWELSRTRCGHCMHWEATGDTIEESGEAVGNCKAADQQTAAVAALDSSCERFLPKTRGLACGECRHFTRAQEAPAMTEPWPGKCGKGTAERHHTHEGAPVCSGFELEGQPGQCDLCEHWQPMGTADTSGTPIGKCVLNACRRLATDQLCTVHSLKHGLMRIRRTCGTCHHWASDSAEGSECDGLACSLCRHWSPTGTYSGSSGEAEGQCEEVSEPLNPRDMVAGTTACESFEPVGELPNGGVCVMRYAQPGWHGTPATSSTLAESCPCYKPRHHPPPDFVPGIPLADWQAQCPSSHFELTIVAESLPRQAEALALIVSKAGPEPNYARLAIPLEQPNPQGGELLVSLELRVHPSFDLGHLEAKS